MSKDSEEAEGQTQATASLITAYLHAVHPTSVMAPRLARSSNFPRATSQLSSKIIPSFLLPRYSCQSRSASILADLRNTPGSYSHKKRVGRGPASGKGKTSGRGHNGQGQRGGTPFVQALGRHFEGGQTPLERSHSKRGFVNKYVPISVKCGVSILRLSGDFRLTSWTIDSFSLDLEKLNLAKLASWISQGRIDPTRPITPRELLQSKCISRPKDGVKLLAGGKETLPTQPLHIIISRASAQAIAAVEAAGGKVSTRYYTKFAFRQILKGRMDPVHSLRSKFDEAEWGPRLAGQNIYRLPDPTSRKAMEYYRDPAYRGYLSYMVPEGQTPSLFFKTPGVGVRGERKGKEPKAKAQDNRLF